MDFEKAVYEALPFTYIGAGVLTIALVDSRLKLMPALLLIVAGMMVWSWRYTSRRQAKRSQMHRKLVRSMRQTGV